jgi:hypothetical protein
MMVAPNAHPFGMHTAAVGHFVKQAVGLQATSPQIAQILTQTREQGGISDNLRLALSTNPGNETRSSGEMDRAVRALEAAARALPQAIAVGSQQPLMQPVQPAIQPSMQPPPGAVDMATHHYDLPDDEVLS